MKRELLTAALLMTGCGGAHATALSGDRAPSIAPAVRELAPDLAARADRANSDAQAAIERSEDEPAADHLQRARLWQIAAEAEAQRIVLSRERDQRVLEIEAIDAARAADETARAEIERAIKRQQAAAIARAEAARVLNEAVTDEARRRGGDPARVDARREASRALVDRGAVILAAAVALGANESMVATAQQALDVARRKPDGSAVGIDSAQTAFGLAQRALGEARSTRPGPDGLERDALMEALASQGWSSELTNEGVVIWLADYFSGNQKELRPGAKTLLAGLGPLLAAHPHGPIQLHVLVTATVSPALAQQRAQRIKASLSVAGDDRLVIVNGARTTEAGSPARVVLPAYGCVAINNDAAQCTTDIPAAASSTAASTTSPPATLPAATATP